MPAKRIYEYSPSSGIVHSPSFKTGIVKIMNNQSMSMSDEEKKQTSLIAQPRREVSEVSSRSDFGINLVQMSDAVTMKKTSLGRISRTSNIVERLNSSAKYIYDAIFINYCIIAIVYCLGQVFHLFIG